MGVTTRGYYTMLLKYRDVLIHHFGLPNRYRYCSFKYRPILKSTDAGKHGPDFPDFREKKRFVSLAHQVAFCQMAVANAYFVHIILHYYYTTEVQMWTEIIDI